MKNCKCGKTPKLFWGHYGEHPEGEYFPATKEFEIYGSRYKKIPSGRKAYFQVICECGATSVYSKDMNLAIEDWEN